MSGIELRRTSILIEIFQAAGYKARGRGGSARNRCSAGKNHKAKRDERRNATTHDLGFPWIIRIWPHKNLSGSGDGIVSSSCLLSSMPQMKDGVRYRDGDRNGPSPI